MIWIYHTILISRPLPSLILPTVTQEAEDEMDMEINKLRLRIRQAEYVHTTMTVQVQQLERKLAEPKDEKAARGEVQEREMEQEGEAKEGRVKA